MASGTTAAAAYNQGFKNPVAIATGLGDLVERFAGSPPSTSEWVALLAIGRFLAANRGSDQ